MTRTQLAAIAGIALIVINSVIMIAASGRAEAQAWRWWPADVRETGARSKRPVKPVWI